MKAIHLKLSESDKAFEDIRNRLTKIEADCSSLLTIKAQVKNIEAAADQNTKQVAYLASRIDDLEDRSRRSNLLFYGANDSDKETWEQSEKLVTEICTTHLGIPIQPSDIERAHRLGAFNPDRKRPIVVKFANYKIKECALSSTKKLKNTDYAISQDYSQKTRLARKQLVEFGKSQQNTFKLRHDKLTIGDAIYIFDHSLQKVVPRSS